MLTEAKNQIKVILLSIQYNIMREMTNRMTFLTNIIFMMLNNATFIIQWLILFQFKEEIGGYTLREVMVLWGLAASTYGFSNILFYGSFQLPDLIIHGKLDAYLVQPKNILLSVITSGTSTPAIGDLLYGFVMAGIFSVSIKSLLLFALFVITGGIIMTAFVVILGSISFWVSKGDLLLGNFYNILVTRSTYPEGIFKGFVKGILFTVIPTGFIVYLPIKIMFSFNIYFLIGVLLFTVGITGIAFLVFYNGLKRYSSSNLTGARI